MRFALNYIHFGFYQILCSSRFASRSESWKRFGAWWLGTITSIHLLLGVYNVVGRYVDKYVFPHNFPNVLVVLALLAPLLYFAGVSEDHSWFGSNIDDLEHLNTSEEIGRAKAVAVGFVVVGMTLFYLSVVPLVR